MLSSMHEEAQGRPEHLLSVRYTTLNSTVQYSAVQYSAVQYTTLQYSIVLMSPRFLHQTPCRNPMLTSMHEEAQGRLVPTLSQVHHSTVVFSTVQYSTVMYCCRLVFSTELPEEPHAGLHA